MKDPMAQCSECSHDLVTAKDGSGEVRCSNTGCRYFKLKHPTGQELNDGLAKA